MVATPSVMPSSPLVLNARQNGRIRIGFQRLFPRAPRARESPPLAFAAAPRQPRRRLPGAAHAVRYRRLLARIGLAPPAPTAEGLTALQQAQLRAIAFENLDPLLGRLPDLAPDALWRKLVLDRRGGYCFELNGLFGAALAALGFVARPVLARVRMGAPEGGARTHLAWVVGLGGRDWLADCGFGGSGPRRPLRLESCVQSDGRDEFRIRADGDERVVEKATADGWFALYGFDALVPRPIDIEAANVVAARWERVAFASNLMLSRQLPDGRISLLNRAGRTARAAEVEIWTLASADDLHARLGRDFGIEVAPEIAAEAWRRLPAD
jgi:N-hydroxyarylamine O-acetyltransferase